jgi:endonuclease/exonuclease/phosphatase family metal-dependent hydrolase
MRFVSYNIQYGTGKDGRVDLARIAGEIGDADVIALQEVVRRMTDEDGYTDQPAAIAALFPEHYWVYGAGIDIHCPSGDGPRDNRRRQFGNMVLSKTPILSNRTYLLPKHGTLNVLSIQRQAVEVVVETPSGPLRVYNVHLGHSSSAERHEQCERLLQLIEAPRTQGGVRTGRNQDPALAPPMPYAAVLLGDFNFQPDCEEYDLLCGQFDVFSGRVSTLHNLIDVWAAAGHNPDDGFTCDIPSGRIRLDYGFVTPDLAGQVMAMTVKDDAVGSDHQPITVDLDL